MSPQTDKQRQIPLFTSNTAPYQPHSNTSRQAAGLILDKLTALQQRVLVFLQQFPEGLTDEEMQNGLQMNPSTQRPRRIELWRRGLVAEHGTRKTASGRPAVVWRAKP